MAKGGQGPKIVIAAVLFLIAGGVIAWQMGLLGGGSDATSPEEQERLEDSRRMQEAIERGEATPPPLIEAAP